jgi:hypothetical protein
MPWRKDKLYNLFRRGNNRMIGRKEFALAFTKCPIVESLVLVAIASPLVAVQAHAQPMSNQQRLSVLRVQNAYQQQQIALALAVQQTNVLLQQARRQEAVQQPSGFLSPLNFSQQQSALQLALQQTTATTQAAMASKVRPNSATLLQVSAIQAAVQTTAALQTASRIQNGQLTVDQIQALSNELTSLTNVLAVPPPQILRGIRN